MKITATYTIFDRDIESVSVAFEKAFKQTITLELGKYATQFIPKTYTEELNDCQRYYIGLDKDKYIHIAFSKMIRNMNFGTIPMPTSMRTIPTCILEDEALYIDINGSQVYINASDFIY